MTDLPPSELLHAYDEFMRGCPLANGGEALASSVAKASAFAAAAYDDASPAGYAVHALARAFLIALINPAHQDLDYLRADPKAGQAARDADERLNRIARGEA